MPERSTRHFSKNLDKRPREPSICKGFRYKSRDDRLNSPKSGVSHFGPTICRSQTRQKLRIVKSLLKVSQKLLFRLVVAPRNGVHNKRRTSSKVGFAISDGRPTPHLNVHRAYLDFSSTPKALIDVGALIAVGPRFWGAVIIDGV